MPSRACPRSTRAKAQSTSARTENFSKQKRDEYTEKDYHKPSDEIKPDWDLAGALEDVQLLTVIGYRVAQGDKLPEWKPGTEFKLKRDEMLKGPPNPTVP